MFKFCLGRLESTSSDVLIQTAIEKFFFSFSLFRERTFTSITKSGVNEKRKVLLLNTST